MLSGRGIDGELKSKFGELTEKFWQSGAKNGNLRAIYLANVEGGSGQALSTLKSNGGEKLLKETSDKVERFFGICVGGRNENGSGCKGDNNNASVVLVGDDPNVNASMTWEKLKEQNWGQTSLVRSGYKYQNLFNKNIWKGHARTGTPKLNRHILPTILKSHQKKDTMKQIFCPWVSGPMRSNLARLQAVCGSLLGTAHRSEYASLVEFLTDSSAKTYFDQSVWGAYGNEWKWVALLTLLKLWTTDLGTVNYSQSEDVFGRDLGGFKLEQLSAPGGSVLFVEDGSNQERVTTITRYSRKKWTVLLRSGSGDHESSQSISVTLSEGELCIQNLVCLNNSDLNRRQKSITDGLTKLGKSTFGTFLKLLLQKTRNNWDSRKTFMALVAACFKDVEKVSFTVQEPLKGGEVVFTQLNNEK